MLCKICGGEMKEKTVADDDPMRDFTALYSRYYCPACKYERERKRRIVVLRAAIESHERRAAEVEEMRKELRLLEEGWV